MKPITMKTKRWTTMFSPDDESHILAANKNNVLLRGRVDEGDDFNRCILIVPRSVYLAAISAWLDNKAGYHKRYRGEFCGVGDIVWEQSKLRKDLNYYLCDHSFNDDDESVKTEKTNVPAYEVTSEFFVDMEHG